MIGSRLRATRLAPTPEAPAASTSTNTSTQRLSSPGARSLDRGAGCAPATVDRRSRSSKARDELSSGGLVTARAGSGTPARRTRSACRGETAALDVGVTASGVGGGVVRAFAATTALETTPLARAACWPAEAGARPARDPGAVERPAPGADESPDASCGSADAGTGGAEATGASAVGGVEGSGTAGGGAGLGAGAAAGAAGAAGACAATGGEVGGGGSGEGTGAGGAAGAGGGWGALRDGSKASGST